MLCHSVLETAPLTSSTNVSREDTSGLASGMIHWGVLAAQHGARAGEIPHKVTETTSYLKE